MRPGLVQLGVVLILGAADTHGVALRIKGPAAQEQLPVQGPRGVVEAARVDEHPCTLLSHQQPQLGEPEVVADAQPDPAELGVEHADPIPAFEGVRLLVGDLAGDVYVEQVYLVHLGVELALRVHHEGRVVVLVAVPSGNGPDGIHLHLPTHFLDGLEGLRVPEVLRELQHVVAGVRRVADLPQHRHLGVVVAGREQGLSDVGNVGLLVGDAAGLEQGQLERLQGWLHSSDALIR